MRTLNIKNQKFRSTKGKTILGLVLAFLIIGISVPPAFSWDGRRPGPRYERRGYWHGRPVYRPYVVPPPPPVYAPPPVFYAPPPPPPGISIFFPPIVIR